MWAHLPKKRPTVTIEMRIELGLPLSLSKTPSAGVALIWAAVPEPSAWVSMCVGAVGILVVGRKTTRDG
jgi:hypothetical protein